MVKENKKTKLEKILIGSSIFIMLSVAFVIAYVYFALFITNNSFGVFLSEIYLLILYILFFLVIFPTYFKKELRKLLLITFHKTDNFFDQCEKFIFKGFKKTKITELIDILLGIISIGLSYFLIAGILTLITFPIIIFDGNLVWWSFDMIIKALVKLPFLILILSLIFLVFNRFVIWILQQLEVVKK